MTVWLYLEKDRETQAIIDKDVFGSLRKLAETKDVYIKGFLLPEDSLRKVLKECGEDYKSDVYEIKKMKLKTKKHSA